jgi:hypothetical protein
MKAKLLFAGVLCALGLAACANSPSRDAATGASAPTPSRDVVRDTGWPGDISYPSSNRAPGAP